MTCGFRMIEFATESWKRSSLAYLASGRVKAQKKGLVRFNAQRSMLRRGPGLVMRLAVRLAMRLAVIRT